MEKKMIEQIKCPRCGNWIRKSWTRKDIFPRVVCTPLGGHLKFSKRKKEREVILEDEK